jgi:hypothetical protein
MRLTDLCGFSSRIAALIFGEQSAAFVLPDLLGPLFSDYHILEILPTNNGMHTPLVYPTLLRRFISEKIALIRLSITALDSFET